MRFSCITSLVMCPTSFAVGLANWIEASVPKAIPSTVYSKFISF